MKKIFKYCLPVAIIFMVYACTKNTGFSNQPLAVYGTNNPTLGQLKINLAFAFTASYNMLIKVNGQVVSGTSSTVSTVATRTPFPGGGYNTNGSNYALYLSVPQGNDTVNIVVPKFGTSIDSIVLYSTIVNIPDNAPYTLHIADTAATSKFILVKNLINDVPSGLCRFRFINLIPNAPAVDVYLNGILIKSNVANFTPTDTFSVATGIYAPGYTAGVAATWAVRLAGTSPTSTALAQYASSNGLQNQAVMTMFSMGYSGLTGTRLPYLCFTLDKNQ